MKVSLSTRLHFRIRRFGWPAAMGALLSAASLVVFFASDAVTRDLESTQEKLRVLREKAKLPPEPVRKSPEALAYTELRRVLPSSDVSVNVLDLLHSSAAKHNIRLASGEYRVIREENDSIRRYQITLPASGTYPEIRAWLAEVFNEWPTLAIDEISFTRQSAESRVVEARVRWVFYFAEAK
jgi:hypothetical protein